MYFFFLIQARMFQLLNSIWPFVRPGNSFVIMWMSFSENEVVKAGWTFICCDSKVILPFQTPDRCSADLLKNPD